MAPDATHTVLIVEDDDDLRGTMSDILEGVGYHVVAATDGEDALAKLSSMVSGDRVCVVLLDLLMPKMDGWTLLEELRTRPASEGVPVLVATSVPSQAPHGARILPKPSRMKTLVSAVRELCPMS